jgi:hypothetical protein
LIGNARLQDADSRTALQKVLVKCEPQLKAMRARAERNRSLVMTIGLENPAPISLRSFVGLDGLIGEGLDPESGAAIRVSYMQFLKDPTLHLRYSAVLLGAPGLGKTPLAKATCCALAKAYQGVHYQTAPEKCYYLMGNTVDMLKEFNQGQVWKQWVPLLLDEFEGTDTRQQGILGENSMKVLTDVTNGGSMRCRYHDVSIPPMCARLFTSNMPSSAGWMAHMDIDEMHGRAIRKRCLFFVVRASVMPMELRNSAAASSGIEVTSAMRAAIESALDD